MAFLPLLSLPAFYLLGLGIYRPYKYGTGRQRHLGLVPLGLFLFGWMIVPLVLGFARGWRGAMGADVQAGPSSVEFAAGILPVVLATLASAVNVWKFRPARAR